MSESRRVSLAAVALALRVGLAARPAPASMSGGPHRRHEAGGEDRIAAVIFSCPA